MRIKHGIAATAAAALMLSLAACSGGSSGSSAAGGGKNIAIIAKGFQFAYWQAVKKGAAAVQGAAESAAGEGPSGSQKG